MNKLIISLASMGVFTLTACHGDDEGMPPMATYEVTITNTTNNQPLSPPAIVLSEGELAWQIGSPASYGLETLAEGGDPHTFLDEIEKVSSISGTEPLLPGHSSTLSISATAEESLTLTVATMLVNTNDAFAGVTGWSLGALEVGDRMKVLAPIYDAGTEANTETLATIPGPAAGGEGYNSARDDVGFVARHPGVVTMDDGLPDSVLDESHRFDNGAMTIMVTRSM